MRSRTIPLLQCKVFLRRHGSSTCKGDKRIIAEPRGEKMTADQRRIRLSDVMYLYSLLIPLCIFLVSPLALIRLNIPPRSSLLMFIALCFIVAYTYTVLVMLICYADVVKSKLISIWTKEFNDKEQSRGGKK